MNEDTRTLTAEEGQEIAEFLGKYWGMDSEEEIDDIRETMRATVIRDYISDGPGYFGPIYFVVFGGGPEFYLVLIKWQGRLERIESEFPFRKPLEFDSWDPNDSQIEHDPGCTGNPETCDCL